MVFDTRPSSRGTEGARARALSELFRSLKGDLSALLGQEVALARLEITQALRAMTRHATKILAGAGLAALGALTIVAGIVVLVGELIGSYWLGALAVAAVLLVCGGIVAAIGARRLRSVDPVPRRSIGSVRTTAGWAKAEVAELKANVLGRGSRGDESSSGASRIDAPSRERLTSAAPTTTKSAMGTTGAPPSVAALSAPAGRTRAPTAEGVTRRPSPAGADADPTVATPRASRGKHQPPPESEGLVEFVKHVVREIQDDQITGQAAKLAYYAFMALPPALMALFGLAGLIGSERFAGWLQNQAAIALPTAVNEGIIGPFIEQVVLEEAPGPFSIGLLLALWGGSALFAGLIDTLNHAYDVEESRSFIRKRGLAVLVMLGGVVLFIAAAGTLLVGPALVEMLRLGGAGALLWNIVQWPVAFAFMVAAFWCAYYFLPNRDQKTAKGVLLKAAAFSAGLWVLATAGFRIYIANFSSYSDTYGFLGAFIILLLWLYVTGLVVLVGGELASEMERRA